MEKEKPHQPRLERGKEVFPARTQGYVLDHQARHERIRINRKLLHQERQHGKQNMRRNCGEVWQVVRHPRIGSNRKERHHICPDGINQRPHKGQYRLHEVQRRSFCHKQEIDHSDRVNEGPPQPTQQSAHQQHQDDRKQ